MHDFAAAVFCSSTRAYLMGLEKSSLERTQNAGNYKDFSSFLYLGVRILLRMDLRKHRQPLGRDSFALALQLLWVPQLRSNH